MLNVVPSSRVMDDERRIERKKRESSRERLIDSFIHSSSFDVELLTIVDDLQGLCCVTRSSIILLSHTLSVISHQSSIVIIIIVASRERREGGEKETSMDGMRKSALLPVCIFINYTVLTVQYLSAWSYFLFFSVCVVSCRPSVRTQYGINNIQSGYGTLGT